MTAMLDQGAVERLLGLSEAEYEALACRAHLGYWTEKRAGLPMSPLHWEWCRLRMTEQRLALIAPREHAKSETFTVNGTVWESIYRPGLWTYIFANTKDQAEKLLERIIHVMSAVEPNMVLNAQARNKSEITFENWAKITIAGAGKSVRGAHPDRIIGDDVLTEAGCQTAMQRKRTERWWLGTVSGMAHARTTRMIGPEGRQKPMEFEPTRVFLVGTPFHKQDLLMNMRENPVYHFRRYAAEFDPDRLVDGMAVEVSR